MENEEHRKVKNAGTLHRRKRRQDFDLVRSIDNSRKACAAEVTNPATANR
jgi:hypothetical protein